MGKTVISGGVLKGPVWVQQLHYRLRGCDRWGQPYSARATHTHMETSCEYCLVFFVSDGESRLSSVVTLWFLRRVLECNHGLGGKPVL